ncbi:hypothetical protein J1N35_028792 [Gossypium stocksii]|uniref:Reverse transcriptase domain-containing protein n=1 Tax=Gossypium stocksii TaxID=47602 RepID=A0A9D3ZSX1_9ROSI|nr:hypothetical protein J1N35_028792 [Gossypium stocksii]
MKVIANRFKSIFPKIIGQEQAGFIAGRSIIDNIIIAQERLQWMAIKIDLEKAYDRIRWDFVEASLNAASIPSNLVKVFWNGEPTQKFRPVRDDLVIFSQADLVFSAGFNELLRKAIYDILGFQEVNDLGYYLGVPLFHRRVTNSILHFLVERVRSRLFS